MGVVDRSQERYSETDLDNESELLSSLSVDEYMAYLASKPRPQAVTLPSEQEKSPKRAKVRKQKPIRASR